MSPREWFWAKLGQAEWPDTYHPVVCHLIDVAQVTRQLWRQVVRAPVKDWVTTRLGLPNHGTAESWLAFWVGVHDIGKITPGFQFQGNTDALSTRLLACGFNSPSGKPKHHGMTGTKILADALQRFCNVSATSGQFLHNIAIAVGGHHGVFPPNWNDVTESDLGNDKWGIARRAMLDELARLLGVSEPSFPRPKPDQTDDQSFWMYLAGLTSVADWIGSNQTFFPSWVNERRPVDAVFEIDTYFRYAGTQATTALKELGWLDRGDDRERVSFAELFPKIEKLRPLQQAVEKLTVGITEPGLMIVEAPMGEGKTEAAWYVADCWEWRGSAGTYVALPTMATSNQMFERVGEFLERGPAKKNVMLLHGKAQLNDQFEKLKNLAQQYDDETKPSAVVAEGWFAANKKQSLLAPYGVGTIDQVLLAVLQTKHVFVRLFGLAGKCVILDEVHAYDTYMTTLMERLLAWLAVLRCPVVLLSATLPKEKRLQLLRAYAGSGTPDPDHKDYPRVTCVSGGKAEVHHVAADEKRAKSIRLKSVAKGDLVGNIRQALTGGGCAAVIRNTVGLAQDTYRELREALKEDGIEVELFHARFPFGMRAEIEKQVLRRYGKDGGPAERNKRVLVATQVVEQSLDLDFDVMVSDVAPVDLVLQRAGRLHRHDRGDTRPDRLKEPQLWLIEPELKDGVPDFGVSEFVYARYVLLLSLTALNASGSSVALPDDLEKLVEQVYGDEPLAIPDTWRSALAESKLVLDEEQRRQRYKAKSVLVRRPSDEDLLYQQNLQLEEDDPEAHRSIQAATRDTEPTASLIVVYYREGGDFLNPDGTDPFDPDRLPDVPRLRRLLENEVSLSHRGCVFHYANQPVPDGWRKSGMLCRHRVVRVGPDGKSMTDSQIQVDYELGIVITRKAGSEGE